MEKLRINGGKKLEGEITIQSSKNAVLPILAASLLTDDAVTILDYPHIADAENMTKIVKKLGCKVSFDNKNVQICSHCANEYQIPENLAKVLRSSIFMLGPIIARFGKAKVAYPGGCNIGLRPIDQHLIGLKKLGVSIKEEGGYIVCEAQRLIGTDVHFDCPSVGATENVMMLATACEGRTLIHNAAREPEIIDLQNFLNAMGAKVYGAGKNTIIVEGGKRLHGTVYKPIPDRIEAGTFLIAAAMTGGEIALENVNEEHIFSLIHKLRDSACKITINRDKIYIISPRRVKSLRRVETSPYPGFPTDLQAQLLTLCTVARGTSMIVENLFETRFNHVAELVRMGADVTVRNRTAVIAGVNKLHGAEVSACDLRGGAALVLAGLSAEGQTVVNNVRHIDRGYENFEGKLCALGADIHREK